MMLRKMLSKLGIRNASLENPSVSLNDVDAWNDLFGSSATSEAGVRVTHEKALSLAPVWQAVSLISGDVAMMPFNVYRRDENGDRDIDVDHPGQFLISEQPNDEMPAFEFWRRLMVHALLWQNGYAYIKRSSRVGPPLEIINLLPDRTWPARMSDGTLFYLTQVDGQLQPLLKEEVLHVKGVCIEQSKGCDLVKHARESIGLALAAEQFGSRFFQNGAHAGGVLEIPAEFEKKAAQNLEEGFVKRGGKDNWFRVAILREGAKFHATTIDAQKSQLTDVREHQVRDVARFFNLPPFKLGLKDSVSYNSSEQSQRVYLASALSHWLAAIVGEVKMKILTEEERRSRSHFVEHNSSAIIETDVKTLNEVLEIQIRNEVISPNEYRRKINLKPRPDGGGDVYANPNTKSNARSTEVEEAQKDLVVDAIGRVARRVAFDAKKAAKNADRLLEWVETGAESHRPVFRDALTPACALIAAMRSEDPDDLVARLDAEFFVRIVNAIDELTRPPHAEQDLVDGVERVCAEFEQTIAADLMPVVFKEAA